MLGGDLPGEISTCLPEGVDALCLRLVEQRAAVRVELRRRHLIEPTNRGRDRIDVTRRHSPACQGILEAGQRAADLLAVVSGSGVAAGLTAFSGEQILGSLGPTLVGERTLPARHLDLDRVEPGLVARDLLGDISQLVAI